MSDFLSDLQGAFNLFASTFAAVFVILDPFAVIGVFMSLSEGMSPVQREQVCRKASSIALALLVVFALLGMSVFNLFGISMPAFQIGGGILLLLTGISQLKAEKKRMRPEETSESLDREDISVFPLATPMIAGPGAISTVVLLSGEMKNRLDTLILVFAIMAAVACCYFVLRSSPFFFKFLGKTGLNLVTRMMGIMLTAISVQFILNGIHGAFAQMIRSGM